MGQEIERKFLLTEVPLFLSGLPFNVIKQGYVATENGGNEVRVRAKGDGFWLTAKSSGTIGRKEVEMAISENDFFQFWALTEGRRLEKHRYEIEHHHMLIEIDIFCGILDGLVLAEVEFENLTDANAFKPFPWMGKEVTDNAKFKNRNLAQLKSYQQILETI